MSYVTTGTEQSCIFGIPPPIYVPDSPMQRDDGDGPRPAMKERTLGDEMVATSERLVFSGFEFNRYPNGLCRAEVNLERRSGELYHGMTEGSGSETGALRCAAKASVQALREFVNNRHEIELLGVKAVHAFDETIVIVSVGVRTDGRKKRFVGSYVAGDSAERAAAIAVLNATNRYLDSNMFSRP